MLLLLLRDDLATGDVHGSLSVTLGDATLSAAGTVAGGASVNGALSVTLEDASLLAAGAVRVTGSTAADLAAAALATTGQVRVAGTLAAASASASLASAVVLPATGGLTGSLEAASLAAFGVVRVSGVVTSTLSDATISAAGSVPVAAAAALTAANATLASAAVVGVAAGVAALLAPSTTTPALGAVRVSGSVSVTTGAALLASAGTASANAAYGDLFATLASATVAAAGAVRVAVAAAPLLSGAALAAVGNAPAAAGLARTLGPAALGATGATVSAGVLSGVLGDASFAATGALRVSAPAVSVLVDDATVSSDVVVRISAGVVVSLDDATLSSEGQGAPRIAAVRVTFSNAKVVATCRISPRPNTNSRVRMLQINSFKVRSLDVDFMELSWKITDTTEDVLDYDMQILRSESEAGPWDVLSVPFQDRYRFYDRFTNQMHNWRSLFYLLRVTNRVTGQNEDFGPIQQQAEADLITVELRRHFSILFREFSGRRCWLLPARTFGQRCAPCWDQTLHKRIRSGCTSCFDTGFVRGYLHPIEVFAQVETGSPDVDTSNAPGKNTARLVNIGGVKPRDILIEGENNRWRVEAVNNTEHGRSPIVIDLSLQKIPPSDIEYKIPLHLDQALKDVFFSPARNFTNPQNLQSFEDEEIPRVFTLYGSTYPER